MFYQWGRKDPYSFATSSALWGAGYQTGKYPVKIYTIDGVLIYQENRGSSNKDKKPAGGIIVASIEATSMMEAIKNPNTLYGLNGPVISQTGHTKGLWDYYWSSYSRGTDGSGSVKTWHNSYLNGYVSQNLKSIYDPCPYGYRVSANGTYNGFDKNQGWVNLSYVGGFNWTLDCATWFSGLGFLYSSGFGDVGIYSWQLLSTPSSISNIYLATFNYIKGYTLNRNDRYYSWGYSVRCIEVFTVSNKKRKAYLPHLVDLPKCVTRDNANFRI